MSKRPIEIKKPAATLPPRGLPGLYFHRFGEGRTVKFAGVVRGMVADSHVLVQYLTDDTAGPLEVVAIDSLGYGAGPNNQAPGSWQFYESEEQMRAWTAR